MAIVPAPSARVARLDVHQLHAMLEAGILREGEPLELLDGVLVYKDRSAAGEDSMTIGKKHNLGVKLLGALEPVLAALGHHMQTQGPVTLPPHDEPEPDGVILRGRPRDYADRLPVASDAEAVFEVADSSLEHDRTTKLALYARAGIAQYVIVNVPDRCVELHTAPVVSDGRYDEVTVLRAGQILVLRVGAEAVELLVDALIP